MFVLHQPTSKPYPKSPDKFHVDVGSGSEIIYKKQRVVGL